MKDCVLCRGLKEKGAEILYNYPLWETENFVVLADRLPVAQYHFIIVSREHYINVWDVLRAGYTSELQEIVNHIYRCLLRVHAGNVFMFEHGQRMENSIKSGKSVEHFHLHVVANAEGMLELLKEKHSSFAHFTSFAEMGKKNLLSKDYLLASNLDENKFWIFIMKDGVPSQYIRMLLYQRMSNDLQRELGILRERGYDWKTGDNTITKRMIEVYYRVLNGRGA